MNATLKASPGRNSFKKDQKNDHKTDEVKLEGSENKK